MEIQPDLTNASYRLGVFFDLDLAQLLELDTDIEAPLYVTAIGTGETNAPKPQRERRGGFGSF